MSGASATSGAMPLASVPVEDSDSSLSTHARALHPDLDDDEIIALIDKDYCEDAEFVLPIIDPATNEFSSERHPLNSGRGGAGSTNVMKESLLSVGWMLDKGGPWVVNTSTPTSKHMSVHMSTRLSALYQLWEAHQRGSPLDRKIRSQFAQASPKTSVTEELFLLGRSNSLSIGATSQTASRL